MDDATLPEEVFTGSFTQQEPIPDEAIESAVQVMRTGRLHRYNTIDGELSETDQLEVEFAKWLGVPYCLACASGGAAMQLALRAYGVQADEPVLTNGYTLAPVPGAIAGVGARPVLVEITDAMVIDLDDLAAKIENSGARLLLISHMRGRLVDMDALMALLEKAGVALIEDCAHTMGAAWRGGKSGTFGLAGCFSAQTYKHVNSGEGGFLTSEDPDFMARAIMNSGSYMLYDRHAAGPGREHFDNARLDTPNCSSRMDNLRAAILRPQLARLDENVERWNARYDAIEEGLAGASGLATVPRPAEETYVGSSIQFLTHTSDMQAIRAFLDRAAMRGVQLKWFGAPEPAGYTSRHDSWRYVDAQNLPKTDAVLARLVDMRIPLTFSLEDCRSIARIIRQCAQETLR
ncbi:MAG: DegT/DnrJ/EryC1/StrS aminotransferase family protein [Pseudomonadota bacterium]